MPPKNSIKEYEENAFYHIYNRGVEKRLIFQDDQDYIVFLSCLKLYLSPLQGDSLQSPSPRLKNYHQQIQLLAYCLMPNHFHLLIHQSDANSINHFMRSLATKYSMYFNQKNTRVGHLFQGAYKAVKVTSEEQLVYLSKYIHLNPTEFAGRLPANYPYSSLSLYLKNQTLPWINPSTILSYFSNTNPLLTYQTFVSQPDNQSILPTQLTLDN